ncbi:hypothetical protein GIB67_016707 [Kingdonia uniflora]|uniref:Uncharacterized protein n=1 Tax=Kingdonia uniflora TaxID=39325 RepID=A0A7J7LMA7_9MAGN|nr:hypothetical protein GIB67_016707 [Kingdonia uniflora]
MDSSCIDESISDSISISPAVSVSPSLVVPDKLCRLGSGTSSVILDPESGVEAESRKLPSSQYKGVVPQPNGRWGAQIYEKHQRVWLGTFNEEGEAAKAYDIAAQRFRGRDAITNFKPLSETEEYDMEASFLSSHSKAEIVDMLRKHTYNDELEQSKRSYEDVDIDFYKRNKGGVYMSSSGSNRVAKACDHLFDKTVTPSDVGKLNRLVIPKQHAEKNFPLQIGSTPKGLLLNFEDNGGKVWRFRYSYWNSSQSYVLTKGWSRFVKEKCLKAGDVVSFLRSTGSDKQLYIDWKPRVTTTGSPMVLQHPIYPTVMNPVVPPVQVVRLFGVNIFKIPVMDCGNIWTNGKRMREVEFSSVDSCKKHCLAGGTF